jgi:predicted GH43/DUF377 family glycosyl hydrolase
MFKWKKMGSVFNPIELKVNDWMQEYAQAPSTIIFINHVRVYFSSRQLPDANGQYISRLAYIDLKRDNLFEIINSCKKPILPLGERGTFDEFGSYPASVIRIGEDIRVYYAGWTRCESVPFNAAIGLAISYDQGDTFNKVGSGPVLSYSPDEPFVLGSPKIRRFNNKWYLWYTAGKKWIKNDSKPEPVYKIRMAQSEDGINWIKIGKDLLESVLEEDECQASPDVFFYRGTYHMFFCYRFNLNFREPGRSYRIGYASSSDLINWSRDDQMAGIELSKDGWDSKSISYPHLFELDNKVFMLYQGNEMGKYGFGLAQMAENTL